jgi:predicted permease
VPLLRDALRALRSAPLVTIAAIVSLALGVGGSTAIFSLLNALALRELSIPRPQELFALSSGGRDSFQAPIWKELSKRRILTDSFAFHSSRLDTSTSGERSYVSATVMSGNAFQVLGVGSARGRTLLPSDSRVGAPPVALIADRFWRSRFGADENIVGRQLSLSGQSHQIVGVLPPSFTGLSVGEPLDVVVALPDDATNTVAVMARIADGHAAAVTEQLRANQPAIRDQLNPYKFSPYREEYLKDPFALTPASRGVSPFRAPYERALRLLLAATGLLLLLACNTVTTLLWSKTIAREKDLKIRVAIGASRRQLMQPQLVEAALLVLGGVMGGAIVAPLSIVAIRRSLSNQSYSLDLRTGVDANTFVFIAAIALIATMIVCWASVWHAIRLSKSASLRTHEAVSNAGLRLGNISAVAQVAVSVVLLTFTFVFVHNYLNIANRRTGFDAEQILIANTAWPNRATPEAMRDALPLIEDAVKSVPGVEDAGIALVMPGGNNALTPWLELADGTKLPQGMKGVMLNPITSGWLPAMGIHIVAGRGLTGADAFGANAAIVVTREFARRFLPDGFVPGTVIYQRDTPQAPRRPLEIVGVAEDSTYLFIKEAFPPAVYGSLAQSTFLSRVTLQVTARSASGNPLALSKAIGDAIAKIEPTASFSFRTLSDQVGTQYARERLLAGLAMFLSGFAIILVGVGIYAVFASTLAYRTHDVAVRMAVGATPRRILATLFTRAAIWSALGVTIGLALTFAANQVVKTLLFETDPNSAMFRIESIAVLIVALILGAIVPAIRATRVNPASLLR